MLLDHVPNIKPIVGVVDNFFKNLRLGALIEAKVGPGRLVVCAINLTDNIGQHPEAQQLKYSKLQYMNSGVFDPKTTLSPQDIQQIAKP